jgi:hypothetical protein
LLSPISGRPLRIAPAFTWYAIDRTAESVHPSGCDFLQNEMLANLHIPVSKREQYPVTTQRSLPGLGKAPQIRPQFIPHAAKLVKPLSSEPSTAGRIVEAVMQPRGLAEEHRALSFALSQTVST